MLSEKKRAIIESCSLFQGLPAEISGSIAELADLRTFRKGQAIFFEGDEAEGFFLIAEGTVKIFKINPSGKEHILHIFGSGEPIGEVAVFHGRPFPASAEALSEGSVLMIRRRDFVELIRRHPDVSMNMLAVLSMRLRQFAVQIENLSLKEVPARLAGYLLFASSEQGGSGTVELSISKGQLASLLGTIPETLSRIFSKLTEEGLITVEGKTITIVDREKLELKQQSIG